MVFTASLLGAQHKKRECGEQAGKLACCVLGQGTERDASTFMWQTGGPPVPNRIIVKLLTQQVVKDDSWVLTSGSPPC